MVGNRTSTVIDGVTTTFTYDMNDQLTSAGTTSFTYDLKGNLLQRSGPAGTIDYEWTPENRLAEVDDGVNVTTFGYDPDGARVSRLTGSNMTRFLVDDRNPTGFSQVVEETDGSGALLSEYQYGPAPATANVDGNRIFYHNDLVRDTRLLTDADGNVTDTYTYSAYGELVASSDSTDQPYLYNGEQFDPAAGAYYQRQRYYDPGIGRFMSRDSFLGVPRLPMSQNPYLFADSDPLSFYDPSGNFTLLGVSISLSINSVLRAINVGLKSTTVCRIKGRIRLFRAIWALRSIGQYFGASNDYGVGPFAPGAGGSAVSQKVTLYSAPKPVLKGSIKQVLYEQKVTAGNSFEMELAVSIAKSSTSVKTGKVNATKDLTTGQWSVGAAGESEKEVGKIKYCGFV
jgi:RHS repeat-associated protein